MDILIEDWALLGVFESEPDRQGLDSLWFYDDSVYTITDDNLRLSFAIHPYHRDVRIVLFYKNNPIYESAYMGIASISVSADGLSIQVNSDEVVDITVRPKISIKHQHS